MLVSNLRTGFKNVVAHLQHIKASYRYARLALLAFLLLLPVGLIAALCSLLGFAQPLRTCLVLYRYNVTNPAHEENFLYFLREGIVNQPGIQYWVVLESRQHGELPPLPPQARYVYAPRPCQTWGFLQQQLSTMYLRSARHSHYVVVDSAVQGPFMAPYAKRLGSWLDALLDRIDDQVKLVGWIISCDIAVLPSSLGDEKTWRLNPHVDPHVMATDKVGLQILLSDPDVTQCYDDMDSAEYYVTSGASLAILESGFSIDSLMLRYKGVDWRQKETWDCNGRISPVRNHHYDGISLDPLEVMFVRMELPDYSRTSYTYNTVQAYKRWQQDPKSASALSVNHVLEHPMQHKLGHVCHLLTRGPTCFDTSYYKMSHDDLSSVEDPDMLWVHFLFYGQFEERAHRFNCSPTHWGALDV